MSQGASGGIGLTQRAIEPPADTKFDYDINRLLFETMERHGSPNGTWTNIAGDGPAPIIMMIAWKTGSRTIRRPTPR